jgi:hypothetical protein
VREATTKKSIKKSFFPGAREAATLLVFFFNTRGRSIFYIRLKCRVERLLGASKHATINCRIYFQMHPLGPRAETLLLSASCAIKCAAIYFFDITCQGARLIIADGEKWREHFSQSNYLRSKSCTHVLIFLIHFLAALIYFKTHPTRSEKSFTGCKKRTGDGDLTLWDHLYTRG